MFIVGERKSPKAELTLSLKSFHCKLNLSLKFVILSSSESQMDSREKNEVKNQPKNQMNVSIVCAVSNFYILSNLFKLMVIKLINSSYDIQIYA